MSKLKTTKEDRSRLRRNTSEGFGVSDYAAEMILDDLDLLESRLERAIEFIQEMTGNKSEWTAHPAMRWHEVQISKTTLQEACAFLSELEDSEGDV